MKTKTIKFVKIFTPLILGLWLFYTLPSALALSLPPDSNPDIAELKTEHQKDMASLENNLTEKKKELTNPEDPTDPGSQDKEIKEFEENRGQSKLDLLKRHAQNLKDLTSSQTNEIENAHDNYEDKYPGATLETFKNTPEYMALITKHAQEAVSLSQQQNQELTLFDQTTEELRSEMQARHANELSDFENESNDEKNALLVEQGQEMFELKAEILTDQYEDELDALQNQLSATSDPNEQARIIEEIDALNATYESLLQNLASDIPLSSEEMAKYLDTLESFGEKFMESIEKSKEKELIRQEYRPTVIPKPSLLPGPSAEKSVSSSGRNYLTQTFLPRVAIAIIGFAGVIALIILIIAGLIMAVAMGNSELYSKAKNMAFYATIGLILAMLSYTLVKIIINIQFEEQINLPAQTEQLTD